MFFIHLTKVILSFKESFVNLQEQLKIKTYMWFIITNLVLTIIITPIVYKYEGSLTVGKVGILIMSAFGIGFLIAPFIISFAIAEWDGLNRKIF